ATCTGTDVCNAATGTCSTPCVAAQGNKQSVGCEYYATFMDTFRLTSCFAAIVANTADQPVHIDVERQGVSLPIQTFARIPSGSGPALTLSPYDPVAGLPPGEVAILFLAGPTQASPVDPVCPVESAVPYGALIDQATGIGWSFRIHTDWPVVAYQINPYGGGDYGATTGASLLLPTSVWDTNYLGVNAGPTGMAGRPPSENI